MDITFCDLCNESVPQADIELGWAVRRSGRLICMRCDAAMSAKAWPFEEARRLLKRYEKAPPEKGYVLFETG